eukprot:TRINITY_DN23047_c0_g2_i1.p1 TRINITY_DN23047_c0_g2~~TRINITY_DN23047_c0_g2_i1.p1  ORF type:complete len:349 (-),score=44.03 TRINITY_DN23047_c0_g2_i1:152-1198(-)
MMANAPYTVVFAYAGCILAATIYGGWALVANIALSKNVNPSVIALYRCVGATAILTSAHLVVQYCKGESRWSEIGASIPLKDLGSFVILGFLMACNVCGFLYASSFLPAFTCSVFQPISPVISLFFSAVLQTEAISVWKAAAVFISVFGAVMVIVFDSSDLTGTGELLLHDRHSLRGYLILLTQLLGSVAYIFVQKEMLKSYSPTVLVNVSYALACFFVLPFTIVVANSELTFWTLNFDRTAWLCVAYGIVFASAVSYSLGAYGNKHTTPNTVIATITVQPFATVVFSWYFFGAIPARGQIFGGCCIVVGLIAYVAARIRDDDDERALLLTKRVNSNQSLCAESVDAI